MENTSQRSIPIPAILAVVGVIAFLGAIELRIPVLGFAGIAWTSFAILWMAPVTHRGGAYTGAVLVSFGAGLLLESVYKCENEAAVIFLLAALVLLIVGAIVVVLNIGSDSRGATEG